MPPLPKGEGGRGEGEEKDFYEMTKRQSGRKKFGNLFLCGFPDYERGKLPKLTYKQKVAYLEYRANKLVIRPLKKIFYNKSINKQLENPNCAVMVGVTSIMCNVIEALGHFLTGKIGYGTAAPAFYGFVNEYMDERYRTKSFKNRKYNWHLWNHFRNGLSHGFLIKDGGIEKQAKKYFEIKTLPGGCQLEINNYDFFEDFKDAFHSYILDLKNSSKNSKLRENFEKVFKLRFIMGI